MNSFEQEKFFRVTRSPYSSRKGRSFHAVRIDPDTLRNCNYKHNYIIHISEHNSESLSLILTKGALVKLAIKRQYSIRVEHGGILTVITPKYLNLIRPSGEQIVIILGCNTRFKGIGPVKAHALWATFGESLFDILDNGDIVSLRKILSENTARNTIDAWRNYINIDAMHFCNASLELSVSTSFLVSYYYQQETISKIREDPYRLLAFGVDFKECDRISQALGFQLDAPIRLAASAEEALYCHLSSGSTLATRYDLDIWLRQLLHIPNNTEKTQFYVNQAFELATSCENILEVGENALQSAGAFTMEAYVAQRLVNLITIPSKLSLDEKKINFYINQYEIKKHFFLSSLQKEAIFGAIKHRFLIINGGAGVGKTTLLDALYSIFRELDIRPIQIALAGKAAKRMAEATNQEAQTIARFIRNFNANDYESRQLVIVIDESSMVDLPSMYRLFRCIPNSAHIIMLGDIGQLPPVDFGLVFHELVPIHDIPKITLTEVRRQDKCSNIPAVSAYIRNGVLPTFNYDDVIHVDINGANAIQKQAVSIYLEQPNETQIICATTKMVNDINKRCVALNNSKPLRVFIEETNCYLETEFKLHDKVMCCSNLYDHDLMNGSTGHICQVYKAMKILKDDGNDELLSSFGKILWDDGIEREISLDIINALHHAYAMTIHKSQGSQFKQVIIVLDKAPNIDRTMCYTAITRAIQKVYLIGPLNILSQALTHESASKRNVDLGHKVKALLLKALL
ncbi:AAA family ATPase [Aeromonas veronii]|nr:AAA family ATPase [Aeromonas veronii]